MMTLRNSISLFVLLVATTVAGNLYGQRVTYKRVEVQRVVDVPKTETRWVEETAYEPETETRYKQVIQTEQRQRERIVKKPKTVTKYRTERLIRRKPVTVKKYRERKTKETSYKTVQGFRDETYTVREPVTETKMKTEKVTVRRPVTKELIEVQRTTTMKPVVTKETAYDVVPGSPLYQAVPDTSRRPRIRLLSAGNYVDPVTGLSVYRRGGLHWVQPNVGVPVAQSPGYAVAREVEKVDLQPEVVETRKPITVTKMVEETEERQVPYEVKKFVERTETRKVPYEYQLPVDNIVVEKVPYTETEYEDEIIERQVPYTVTEMQEERTIETYEVEVPRYVEETVKKEKQIRRWVEKEIETTEQRKIVETMKVPIGPNGQALSDPVPLDAPEYEFVSQIPSVGRSTTRKPTIEQSFKTTASGQAVVETHGTIIMPKNSVSSKKPTVIDVPETKTEPKKLVPIKPDSATEQPDLSATTSPVVETSGKEPTPVPDADQITVVSPEASVLKKAPLPKAGSSLRTGNEQAAD